MARRNFSLETRLNYSPSDAFETLPIPDDISALRDLGIEYARARTLALTSARIGLTEIYNRLIEGRDTTKEVDKIPGAESLKTLYHRYKKRLSNM